MALGGELQDWIITVPFLTRYWFGLTVLFTLLGRFGLLLGRWLVLDWYPLVHQFQIWRPVTALFYYPLSPATGFHFLINLYFLYNYSQRLEMGIFASRQADYMFMLLFNWACCVVASLFMDIHLLMDSMVLSVLYVWCQINKDQIVTFWFGTQFKAMYLPWVLFAFNLIIAGGGIMELIGILAGHLYFFLMFKYPQDFGGPSLLSTPEFLYSWFPNRTGGIGGFGRPPVQAQAPGGGAPGGGNGGGGRFGGYSWGRGQRLGD